MNIVEDFLFSHYFSVHAKVSKCIAINMHLKKCFEER
jgi:hypothetical protein